MHGELLKKMMENVATSNHEDTDKILIFRGTMSNEAAALAKKDAGLMLPLTYDLVRLECVLPVMVHED